jgi:hypothetical protein
MSGWGHSRRGWLRTTIVHVRCAPKAEVKSGYWHPLQWGLSGPNTLGSPVEVADSCRARCTSARPPGDVAA